MSENNEEVHTQPHQGGTISLDAMIKLGTFIFTLGTGVVAFEVNQVTTQLSTIDKSVKAFDERFNNYVLITERRITFMEDYQKLQDSRNANIEDEIRRLRDGKHVR